MNEAAGRTVVVRRLGRYEVREELGRGATGVVYEACDTESGAVVALKTLVSMDPENLFRLKHEFRSLANLEHDSFVRFGELACEEGQWFFTMERVYGADFLSYVRCGAQPENADDATQTGSSTPVSHARVSRPADPERRLLEALAQLVQGLAALHGVGRIHRDVKPSNVLVTTQGRVVLLDFGLTTAFGPDERLLGTPLYMAPEQIVCEELTPAADWYAVGAMMFEGLTGRPPYEGSTPEILDAKLNQDAPRDLGNGVPENLRALCLALLERDPRARPGVEEIRERLGLVGPDQAPLREVFIGRERELGRLQRALDDVPTGGARAVVVRGEPGIGKSILVERFLSGIPAQTLVLRGRCYEQENVPFGGVDSLVDALSEYLLGLPAKAVEGLVAAGVSNVARVFPVLRRVPLIAEQHQDGPILNPASLREQAFGELARLVRSLGQARRLVVFIDDVQWLDRDSLALIRAVFLSDGARCLVVATLRSGSKLSPEIAGFAESLETIELQRLSNDESLALWRALGAVDVGAVRDHALREAAGHPLFLTELLRSAHAGSFEQRGGARLEDVLWARVSERDEVDIRFMEMTALAGSPMPYAVLARAAGLDVGECLTRLSGLRAAQLVRALRIDDDRCVEAYHERIREAILERLRERGDAAVERLHLKLGWALAAGTEKAALRSRVFAVVHHLNLGRRQIDSSREKSELAELNLLASQEAHRSTAFERSREYASLGIECLPDDAWMGSLDTWRDLHVAQFTAEYLTLGRDAARPTFAAAKARMRTPQDKAAIYCPWITLETTDFPRDAVAAGCEILRELGSQVPFPASKLRVLAEYAGAHFARRGRPAEAFETAPKMRDDAMRSLLRILVVMMAPAYFCDENLFPWISLRRARISMKMGMSDASPIGLAGYGMVLTGAFANFAEGAAFGRSARALARADKSPLVGTMTEFLHSDFLAPWVAPLAESRRDLAEIERAAALSGNTQYETYSALDHFELGRCMGVDLSTTLAEAAHAREVARRHGLSSIVDYIDAVERALAVLRGPNLAGFELLVPSLSIDPAILRYELLRAEMGYLGGIDVPTVERHLAQVDRLAHTAFANVLVADICFVRALVAARAWESASPIGRARRILQVARGARTLARLARSCAANFEPQALIVRAELARILGRARAATHGYERAIASAETHGSLKRRAVAYELASDHARARGEHAEAVRYRRLAAEAYGLWGATAKANMLAADVASPAE
jgi:predicted ATPase